MPSKFTRQDLKDGKAKVSVLGWMAGLDPVIPAKKKSTKRPKGGWFSSRTKTRQPDKYYDADESSSGDDSDASIVVIKKDGHKSILKNGVNRPKSNPVRSKKAAATRRKHTVILDTTSDESGDSSTTYDSETSSEAEAAPPAQTTTATGGNEESSSESIPAATTTEAETTDAETSAMSEDIPAAPATTPVSGPTTEAEEAAGGSLGAFLDMMTTDDEATQTEPVATHDEAVQATPAVEETPAEPVAPAPAPAQPVMPAAIEAQPAPADPDWTPSQDAILTAMKEGREPWKAIATALGKSKKDVVARWKLLVKNKNANSTSTAGPNAPPPAPVSSPAALAVNTVEVPHHASLSNAPPPSIPSSKQSKQSKGKGKAPVPSSPSSGVSVDEALEARQSHEEEMRNMLEHLYSAYSDQYSSRLRPDAAFSELDCRVLSLLNAKIRAEKWLSLQAAFYNVTGRMVPVALLREKMDDGEEGGD